jgi:hypothetical protein
MFAAFAPLHSPLGRLVAVAEYRVPLLWFSTVEQREESATLASA